MGHLIKRSKTTIWLATFLFTLFFAIGCNNSADETKVIQTDTMVSPAIVEPSVITPVDTLPPIDTSAASRPIPIKTVQ